MIRKVFFLTISTFNQRDFKRFGIELLEKNGFCVEVWDFTNILFPQIARNHKPPDLINWSGHKVFKDKKHALKNLEDLDSDTLIITFMPYNPKYYSIYKAISTSDAKYAPFCANAYPSAKSAKKKKIEKLLYNLKKLQKNPFNNLINYTFLKVPSSWARLKPASLILAGGTESLRYQPPVDRSSEILWIHALDYDLYLEEKGKPSAEKPTAVFLDEYLPSHPDFFRHNIPPPVESGKYYPLLNKFFTLIEQQLKLKIIIAAHPRSHYEDLSDLFEGREGVQGQTIKLVKESRLVLAHTSNAINFANLFHKPIIFLTSLGLNKSHIGAKIRETASLFGKNPVYLDRDPNIDWDSELKVSKIHYENYLRDYIKTDYSEELPFWQIVANRLKKEL